MSLPSPFRHAGLGHVRLGFEMGTENSLLSTLFSVCVDQTNTNHKFLLPQCSYLVS